MEDTFLFFVSIILLAAPFIDWTATLILRRASDEAGPEKIAILERSRMALVLAMASTINGFLAYCRLANITLGSIFVILLGISLILSSVPNLYWLTLYLRKRFNR